MTTISVIFYYALLYMNGLRRHSYPPPKEKIETSCIRCSSILDEINNLYEIINKLEKEIEILKRSAKTPQSDITPVNKNISYESLSPDGKTVDDFNKLMLSLD